jgi:hypothetical protein
VDQPASTGKDVSGATEQQLLSDAQRASTSKIVVSDSVTTQDAGPCSDTTTIARRVDAHKAIAELKVHPGKDIVTFGSRVRCNDEIVHI